MYLEGSPELSAAMMAATCGRQRNSELEATTLRGRQGWFPPRGRDSASFVQLAPGIVLLGGPPDSVRDAVLSLDQGKEPTCDPKLLPLLPERAPQAFFAASDAWILDGIEGWLAAPGGVSLAALGIGLDVTPRLRAQALLRPSETNGLENLREAVCMLLPKLAADARRDDLAVLADLLGRVTVRTTVDAVHVELALDEAESAKMSQVIANALHAWLGSSKSPTMAARRRAQEEALRAAQAAVEEARRRAAELEKQRDGERDKDKRNGKDGNTDRR